MQNKEPVLDDGEVEYEAGPESAWGNFEDDDDVRNFHLWVIR
jgi:hypothetical protein